MFSQSHKSIGCWMQFVTAGGEPFGLRGTISLRRWSGRECQAILHLEARQGAAQGQHHFAVAAPMALQQIPLGQSRQAVGRRLWVVGVGPEPREANGDTATNRLPFFVERRLTHPQDRGVTTRLKMGEMCPLQVNLRRAQICFQSQTRQATTSSVGGQSVQRKSF